MLDYKYTLADIRYMNLRITDESPEYTIENAYDHIDAEWDQDDW